MVHQYCSVYVEVSIQYSTGNEKLDMFIEDLPPPINARTRLDGYKLKIKSLPGPESI